MIPLQSRAEYPEPGGEEFTSGHSGTDTSQARAVNEKRSGTTKERHAYTLKLVRAFQGTGLTVVHLREVTGWHHGQASAALSNLHKAGSIVRLAEVRDRCKVYVAPRWVLGRETEEFASRVKAKRSDDLNEVVDKVLAAMANDWRLIKNHHPVGAYLPVGQLDGDCSCGNGEWPCPAVRTVVDEIVGVTR